MTTNSELPQENLGQNTQLHPKDDKNIAFYHTFEVFLPKTSSRVHILDNHKDNLKLMSKIPTRSFWKEECADSDYTINTLNLYDHDRRTHPYTVTNPSLISYLEKGKMAKYEIVYGDNKSESLKIQPKEIPGLAQDYKVQNTPEIKFNFVKNDNDCKVLTVQEDGSQSSRKIDLPSKACVHVEVELDNGEFESKLECSEFGHVRTIEKPEGSATHYMTITKDLKSNYKCYFSDKEGRQTNDLEFSLNDLGIKENQTLLRILESNHHVSELYKKTRAVHDIVITDEAGPSAIAIEDSKGQLIAAILPDITSGLLENEEFKRGVRGDAGPDTSEVAESLLTSKGPELGSAILHAMANNDGNAGTVLSHLAEDTNLQTGVAKNLKEDISFQGKIKGKDGVDGTSPSPQDIANVLLKPSSADTLVQKLLLKEMIYLGDTTYTPKTLATKVTETLKGDPNFTASVKGTQGEPGTQGDRGPEGAKGRDGTSPTPDSVASELLEHPMVLGRAVLGAEELSTSKPISTIVTHWAVGKLEKSPDLQKGVADELLKKPAELGIAVLDNHEKEGFSQYITGRVKDDIEREIGNFIQIKKTIQRIEGKVEDEEGKIFQLSNEAKTAADKSVEHAIRSENAADKSVEHAIRSENAATTSTQHATRSEVSVTTSAKHAENSAIAATTSTQHATKSETAAQTILTDYLPKAQNAATTSAQHATRSETAANESKEHADRSAEHREDARLASDSAAAYEDNVKEIACAVNPQLKGCSPRSRREAIWEELEDSENQIFQHESSEFAFQASDHNDFSVV